MSRQKLTAQYVFDFYTVQELFDIPEPDWLIDGVIKRGSFAQLYGAPGTWKTFAALNWALSVASGTEWMHGKCTYPGNVVYIIGEGLDEFGKRIKAWLEHRGLALADIQDRIRFVPEAVQLLDEAQIEAFLKGLAEAFAEPPVLIIVDTLSRSLVGIDEDKAQFMTQAIHAVEVIHEQTQAAVLALHHAPYNADRGRGSSTLPGALDTIVGVRQPKKEALSAEFYCAKQKNAAEFEPMTMQLLRVGESLVATFGSKKKLVPEDLSGVPKQVWDCLVKQGTVGCTSSQVIVLTDLPRTSVYRELKLLADNDLVTKVGPLYIAKHDAKIIKFPTAGRESHSPTP